MKDLVDYIVKNIVSKPEKVEVEEEKEDSIIRVNLKVDPGDMGMVIGRNGQTIQAIRKLLTVRAMAEGVKVYLNLIDQEPREPQVAEVKEPEEASPSAEVIDSEGKPQAQTRRATGDKEEKKKSN